MRGPSASEARASARAAAKAVVDWAAGAYGPHGGMKWIKGQAVRGGAAAICDVPVGPWAAPYRSLAQEVRRHAGDQATLAMLLAARLVAAVLDGPGALPRVVAGVPLAKRQAIALVDAHHVAAPDEVALAAIAPPLAEAVPAIVAGLPALARDGVVALDAIDVRAEPQEAARWLEGLVVDGPRLELSPGGGVLIVDEVVRFQPRRDAQVRRVEALTGMRQAEERRRAQAVARAQGLKVSLLATPGAIDDDVRARLESAGIVCLANAPLPTLQRLRWATGARPVPNLEAATAPDLGSASILRRPRPRGGWLVAGDGPGATLVVPAGTEALGRAMKDDAEQVLRAAGCVARRPGALPGGGRWQRQVAAGLRRAADAAPGQAPLAVRAAALAFERAADDLVRNAGADPTRQAFPSGSEGVVDAYGCVRHAVAAAFECAYGILRIDAAWAKTPSDAATLRGGGQPRRPRDLQGDVPPLM